MSSLLWRKCRHGAQDEKEAQIGHRRAEVDSQRHDTRATASRGRPRGAAGVGSAHQEADGVEGRRRCRQTVHFAWKTDHAGKIATGWHCETA